MRIQGRRGHLHQVVLEELLQLSLGGRVREVPNVESPTLGGAGDDGLVLGGVDGLVAAGADAGAFGGASGLVEGGVGHLGGDAIDRSRHFVYWCIELFDTSWTSEARVVEELGVSWSSLVSEGASWVVENRLEWWEIDEGGWVGS